MRRDLARPVALALNVVFAVLLTALATLLLVVGVVGLIGPGETAPGDDAAATAYSLAVLGGVVGIILLPAVYLIATGVGRYMRRESGRRLRAADIAIVAAYLLVAAWFGLRLPLFVHGLGAAAIVALVALVLDLRASAASPEDAERDREMRSLGRGRRIRRPG